MIDELLFLKSSRQYSLKLLVYRVLSQLPQHIQRDTRLMLLETSCYLHNVLFLGRFAGHNIRSDVLILTKKHRKRN
ncbi:MAG: hypothetical protein CM15mL1_0270 [Libanvirus sp.]|nr:MAG: hypothetical protein CM15mL1_0270 [Libanvirus sp.]